MKIGCGTVLFRKFELERALATIREIGFRYFETQAVGPWCPHVDVNKDDPENLVRLQKKYGFDGITGLWSLNGNIISNENSVESGIRSIEWAAAAGIPVVHTGDGHKPKDMSTEDAYRVLEERISRILEAAKKYHVILAIEPHGTFSLTSAGLCRMMRLAPPDVLGINYDAANMFRACYVESGNGQSSWQKVENAENELEVLKVVHDRVVHCHAKDLDENHKCVPVGTGLVQVGDCVKYLKSIGYNGVVSVETEGSSDFDAVVDLATKSYQYLKSIIGEAET